MVGADVALIYALGVLAGVLATRAYWKRVARDDVQAIVDTLRDESDGPLIIARSIRWQGDEFSCVACTDDHGIVDAYHDWRGDRS